MKCPCTTRRQMLISCVASVVTTTSGRLVMQVRTDGCVAGPGVDGYSPSHCRWSIVAWSLRRHWNCNWFRTPFRCFLLRLHVQLLQTTSFTSTSSSISETTSAEVRESSKLRFVISKSSHKVEPQRRLWTLQHVGVRSTGIFKTWTFILSAFIHLNKTWTNLNVFIHPYCSKTEVSTFANIIIDFNLTVTSCRGLWRFQVILSSRKRQVQ